VARLLLLDQYHLSFLVPPGLSGPHRRLSKVLNRARFRRELAQAVRAVLARYPEFTQARVRLSS
jgi:hypothetical protein